MDSNYGTLKRYQGHDHLIVFAWDQGSEVLGWNSPLHVRLSNFTYLTHVGYKNGDQTFRPTKDIVIPPYVESEMPLRKWKSNENARNILASFRGTILSDQRYSLGTRQHLRNMNVSDLILVSEGHHSNYWEEIIQSEFGLCPMGWTYWTARMFECILVETIPLVITKEYAIFPYEDLIDYQNSTVRISIEQFLDMTDLDRVLLALLPKAECLRENLKKIKSRLKYNLLKIEHNDAVDTLKQILEKKRNEKCLYNKSTEV